MSKEYGYTRIVSPGSDEYSNRKSDFQNLVQSSAYDETHSYFSNGGGGYVLFSKGRNYDVDEMTAAKALADDGNIVTMTPERGEMYASAYYKGKPKFSDGKVFAELYEQRTPNPQGSNLVNSVNNALEHAKEKKASISLIYDKYGSFHRNHIKEGIAKYVSNNVNSDYNSVKNVIVVDKDRGVHYWTVKITW